MDDVHPTSRSFPTQRISFCKTSRLEAPPTWNLLQYSMESFSSSTARCVVDLTPEQRAIPFGGATLASFLLDCSPTSLDLGLLELGLTPLSDPSASVSIIIDTLIARQVQPAAPSGTARLTRSVDVTPTVPPAPAKTKTTAKAKLPKPASATTTEAALLAALAAIGEGPGSNTPPAPGPNTLTPNVNALPPVTPPATGPAPPATTSATGPLEVREQALNGHTAPTPTAPVTSVSTFHAPPLRSPPAPVAAPSPLFTGLPAAERIAAQFDAAASSLLPLCPALDPSQLASVVQAVMKALASQAPTPASGVPSQHTLVLGRPDAVQSVLIRRQEEAERGKNLLQSRPSVAAPSEPVFIDVSTKRRRTDRDHDVPVATAPAVTGYYAAPQAHAAPPAGGFSPLFVTPVVHAFVPPPPAVPAAQVAAGPVQVQAGALPVSGVVGGFDFWFARF